MQKQEEKNVNKNFNILSYLLSNCSFLSVNEYFCLRKTKRFPLPSCALYQANNNNCTICVIQTLQKETKRAARDR